MKKLLIGAALITLLIPLKVKAVQKPRGCVDKKADILLERKDSFTVVCYRYIRPNNGKPRKEDINYFLVKWNEQDNVDYEILSSYSGTQIGIWIVEKQESTIFYLKDRRFDYWYMNPNPALVNKHKNDITALLDDMEKIQKLQEAPVIKNF